MKKKNIFIALALALAVTACGNEEAKTNKTEITEVNKKDIKEETGEEVIYASFYPTYNLTKQIAGDKFEVRSFNSLTTESHGFEPSAKEIAELGQASLIFMNGAGMEEWKDDVSGNVEIDMVDTSKGLDLIKAGKDKGVGGRMHDHDKEGHRHDEDSNMHDHGEEGHHHHGEYDPHTWLSPVNAKAQAKVICDKLSEIDPANKEYYEANYEKIASDLDELIEEYTAKFNEVDNKKFIVPHEAFGYVARDFGLEQIPLASLTSTDDPDAKVLKEMIDLARAEQINTVFFEKGGSDKAAKTIADEIGADTKPLDTMEFASQEDLNKGLTLQELIKVNLENIYKSLA